MATEFSDFQLEQLSFEVRYNEAFELWDHAGALWADVRSVFGSISSEKVAPNSQTFYAAGRYSFHVDMTTAWVIDHQASAKDGKSADFISLVLAVLDVQSLVRVGVRTTHLMPVKTMEAGNEAVRALTLMRDPASKLFDVEPNDINPLYQSEVSDGEFGYTLRIGTRGQNVDFSPPPTALGLKPQTINQFHVFLDLDMFTMKAVPIEVFEPKSWLERRIKVANADLPKALELGR